MSFLALGLAACNATPTQHSASTTVSPPSAPAVQTPCPEPVTAIFGVRVNPVGAGFAGDLIHCLSVTGEATINDRLMEWPPQNRQLVAADSRSVIELEGSSADDSSTVVVFDLASGGRRSLGTLSQLGIGDPGPLGGVLSPDGTQLAIGGGHKLLLVQVQSAAVQTLATVAGDRWLMPLRWTTAGILATKVGYEGMGDFGLVKVDPASGTISVLNQGPNNQLAISPSGRFFATTAHVDLGDGPTVRYPWQNAIDLTGPDGTATRIITEKNHWFTPLDVSDDGLVLFASDSQTDPVAADMGIYVAKGGHPTQQLSSSFSGEWGPARFLDASRVLVSHLKGGTGASETSVDLELYRLCVDTAAACDISGTRTTAMVLTGTWPTVVTSIVVLPAAA